MKLPDYKKIALIGVLVLVIVVFFSLGLDRYLSLSYIQESRSMLEAVYNQHTFLVMGGYFLVYILVTALSLPGAAVMTLAGGAFFGFWIGLLLISFASTIGASLACLVARYLFRDWAQAKLHNWFEKINAGIRREGSFYLFTMRLIPAIPFFVINLGMALTNMRLATFYWVSQLGMLPGTAVYVNAGKQLGEISSPGDILSLDLIVSFVILGIFPLAVKKIMNYIREKTGKGRIKPEEGI